MAITLEEAVAILEKAEAIKYKMQCDLDKATNLATRGPQGARVWWSLPAVFDRLAELEIEIEILSGQFGVSSSAALEIKTNEFLMRAQRMGIT